MKLVTYTTDARARAGILAGNDVIDLVAAFSWHDRDARGSSSLGRVFETYGTTVLDFIERADVARPAADKIAAAHAEKKLPALFDGMVVVQPLSGVRLLSPLPRPPSMRDGYAFRQHVETARKNRGLEMIPEFDQFPVFYFTNHQAVIGPGDLRVQKRHLERLDYELEAAVVVGKEARNLTAKNADSVIFGMTIMNDFSARALQMDEMKLSLGPAKGKDFATGLGPYLATLDELTAQTKTTPNGNVFDMAMRAFVNGQELSRGNVKDMNWTFAQILERASYGVTLYPGDVIGSGTCGTGCFLELNGSKITKDQWLQPGDKIALEIDGLGRLENTVVLDNP